MLNESALRQVLGNEQVKNLPVVVISINGRKRTGKSFMLTQFVKYLYQKNDPEWVNRLVNGSFEWAGGQARVTFGINIRTEPIVVEINESGQNKKIAVVLLDCQGLFDPNTPKEQECKLLAFSALLSSVFIFNDNTGLSEDIMSYLNEYAEYAKLIGANCSASNKLD